MKMENKQKNSVALKSVIWLIISAFLLVTILPSHYHLHHDFDVDPSAHAHSVDLHLLADKSGSDHHDEDIDSFAATPDGTVKNNNNSIIFLLSSFVIFVLALAGTTRIRKSNINFLLKQQTYFNLPPLRAPPIH